MFRFEDYIGYPDDGADGNLYFRDVVLKKPIKEYPVGTKFPSVIFVGESIELQFFDYDHTKVMTRVFELV